MLIIAESSHEAEYGVMEQPQMSTDGTETREIVRNKNTASLMPTKININRGFVLKRQLVSTWLSIRE